MPGGQKYSASWLILVAKKCINGYGSRYSSNLQGYGSLDHRAEGGYGSRKPQAKEADHDQNLDFHSRWGPRLSGRTPRHRPLMQIKHGMQRVPREALKWGAGALAAQLLSKSADAHPLHPPRNQYNPSTSPHRCSNSMPYFLSLENHLSWWEGHAPKHGLRRIRIGLH